jgi:hypothetical protein
MRVRNISSPLPGERVVEVSPELKPVVDAGWHKRLNLYNGRNLSDAALTTQQDGIAGRLGARGQSVSPGLITGLETGFEIVPQEGAPQFIIYISPGMGLAASGEDVIVTTP